jgi:hypothetical protein
MEYFSARHFRAKHFQSISLRIEVVPELINPPEGFVASRIPLAVTLELPLPESLTQIVGIHQSDVIIRSALEAALADIRANPWLLDYVFASLPQDTITWKQYGERDVQEAKKWFLSTNIDVTILPTIDESRWPKLTVEIVDSREVEPEASIGDVNYTPYEQNDSSWPALNQQPITPSSYTPSTGIVKLPAAPEFGMYAGMYLVDRVGQEHEILEIIDETTFKIDPGTVADLSRSNIKSRRPSWNVAVESSSFKETYRIGVHVQNEPAHLIWLHSIVVFAIQRYKQVLMEARGLERTTFGSTQIGRDERFEAENIFSRYLSLSGYVRQFWPKAVTRTIDGVDFDNYGNGNGGLRVSGQNADVEVAKTGLSPDDQEWIGNLDTLRKTK